MLTLAPWNAIGTCDNCNEIVLGERSPYRPLDVERACPHCRVPVRIHGENNDPNCPKCDSQVDIDSGLVFRGLTLPPLELSSKVQFKRLGISERHPIAIVGNQKARLTGGSSNEEGIWWGEGVVTSLEPLSVEVVSRLTEPKTEPTRLEILFPVTKLPLFAVDLNLLRQESEVQPLACQSALSAWAPMGWEYRDGIAEVELDPLCQPESTAS